jgi:hypothetical protein
MKIFFYLAFWSLALVFPARAATELPLTPQQRALAIKDIAAAFESIYVIPEVGNAIARDLRARQQRGEYDRITASRELAAVLSRHIDAICHDPHTEVAYFEDDQLVERPTADPVVMKQREDARRARALAKNFDFAEPKRLDGNVALVRFDSFHRAADAAPLVHRIMSAVADADALIFDLRENGGGSPDLIAVLASYLFDEKPVHLYDQVSRRDGTHVQAWTDPDVPGKRFGSSKPVYILTSKETFSAAENFAYTLQQLGRATVIGERTAGGAHGAFGKPVTSHLVPMVATKRTINAVTKSDWNRVGVIPEVAVPAAGALAAALAQVRPARPRGDAASAGETVH